MNAYEHARTRFVDSTSVDCMFVIFPLPCLAVHASGARDQGLPLEHFSGQPETFLVTETLKPPSVTILYHRTTKGAYVEPKSGEVQAPAHDIHHGLALGASTRPLISST